MTRYPEAFDDARLVVAIEAARFVGSMVQREASSGNVQVNRKSDGSLVTNLDTAGDAMLAQFLGHHYPEIGYLGEEIGERGPLSPRWIVDPIDGTFDLVGGRPGWAVLIALEIEGRIDLGVMYDPMSDTLYWAKRGSGAFRNLDPIKVSGRRELPGAVILHGGLNRFLDTPDWPRCLRLIARAERLRAYGSYDFGFVADGRADLCFERSLAPWDIAAPKVIIEEAGGRVTDERGGDGIYDHTVTFFSNEHLHDSVLSLFNE